MSLQNSSDIIIENYYNSEIATRKTTKSLDIPLSTSETNLSSLSSENIELDPDQDQQQNPSKIFEERVSQNPLRPLVSLPTESDPADTGRASHVSLLAGKYLVFATPGSSNSSKDLQKCINVETREQFMCKNVPRNASGLSLLAAYHRLEEFSDCIGSIHEIILAPKSLYMIFAVNFGSVHSYILQRKKVNEQEAASLFRQIVSAVHYCHGKGIVLRDLKMGKFVFADKERTIVKLESLEDAVILNDCSDDSLSDKHGCPNYVSPEKADILRSNNKYPGKATDIWGLGIILYTMLVGRYPFNDSDHTKLFVKIKKGHFSLPDNLSTSVKCLIRCLLRKDPSGRLTCDQILKHPWIVSKGRVTSQTMDIRRSSLQLGGREIRMVSSSSGLGSTTRYLYSPANGASHLKSDPLTPSDDQVVPDIQMA